MTCWVKFSVSRRKGMLLIWVLTAYFSNNFSSSKALASVPEETLEALPVFCSVVFRFLCVFGSWGLESYSKDSAVCCATLPDFDPASALRFGPLAWSKEAVSSAAAAEFYRKICDLDLLTFMLTMLIWAPAASSWYWSSEILSWSGETGSTCGNSCV